MNRNISYIKGNENDVNQTINYNEIEWEKIHDDIIDIISQIQKDTEEFLVLKQLSKYTSEDNKNKFNDFIKNNVKIFKEIISRTSVPSLFINTVKNILKNT